MHLPGALRLAKLLPQHFLVDFATSVGYQTVPLPRTAERIRPSINRRNADSGASPMR